MKTLNIGLIIAGLLTCCSCAVTDVDRTADLSKYRTFGWGKMNVEVGNPAYKSDLIDANIKATILNEFAGKGITYTSRKPDLLVSYQAYTEKRMREYTWDGVYYPYVYPYYSSRLFPYGGYMAWPPVWTREHGSYPYTHGTLIVDMKDRKSGKLIWRGIVQGSVDNVKSLQKTVSKGVKAIMKKYPNASPAPVPIPKEKVSS